MQDQVVDRFAKVLGDEFVMLRNAIFPGVEVAVPLILVGPFGLRVMDTTAIRGTYRAKGDQWMVLDSGGSFKSSRPIWPPTSVCTGKWSAAPSVPGNS